MEVSKAKAKKERNKKVFKVVFDSPFDLQPTLLDQPDCEAALRVLSQVIEQKQGKVLVGQDKLLNSIQNALLPCFVFIFYSAELSPLFKEVYKLVQQLSIPYLVLPLSQNTSLQKSLKVSRINVISLLHQSPDTLQPLQQLLGKSSLSLAQGLLPLRTVQLDATRKQIRKRRPKKKPCV